jgi:hypothetical protein
LSCKPQKSTDQSGELVNSDGKALRFSNEEQEIIRYLTKNGSSEMISSVLETRREIVALDFDSLESSKFTLNGQDRTTAFALCSKVQLSLVLSQKGGCGGGGLCIDIRNPLGSYYRLTINSFGFTTEL